MLQSLSNTVFVYRARTFSLLRSPEEGPVRMPRMMWFRIKCVGWMGLLVLSLFGPGCSGSQPCSITNDCPQGQTCLNRQCQESKDTACLSNDDCGGETLVCDRPNQRCVVCLQDSDCSDGKTCQAQTCQEGFRPECQADKDCANQPQRFCSGNGKCEWECLLPSDCKATEMCSSHRCVKKANNNFCVTDADCAEQAKTFCSTAGNCEWSCRSNTDCGNGQTCETNQCKGEVQGCKADNDCPSTQPKCATSGQCVACLTNADCGNGQTCEGNQCKSVTNPNDCSQGCPQGQFCFLQKRCIKTPTACTDNDDCTDNDICMDLGNSQTACLPACDPTQNKSDSDLTNTSCWSDFGWCYSISDEDPKQGACYPPQANTQALGQACGNDSLLDKPSYHLCQTGLRCIEEQNGKTCWRECDPNKNVGGDPAQADKNPACSGGQGLCYPLEGGGGACEPTSTQPPKASPPAAGELTINEVLADPPSGQDGDANKDQTRHSYNDEFVEIVNVSTKALQLDGVTLGDSTGGGTVRYTFPQGSVLQPQKAVVVFGGGMTQDVNVNTGKPHPSFGGALVYTVVQGNASSTNGLNLANSGRTLQLKDTQGKEIATFTYGDNSCLGNKDQSVTRSPDNTGTCALHKDTASGAAFSPGTKTDGTAF
ncbi:MAG: lamin tail domain-containing protein [Deltaproteobacteria bacterium]|nr:MAG: lamin tail domain-containing protein [Deltaproteobacteria bacterium]